MIIADTSSACASRGSSRCLRPPPAIFGLCGARCARMADRVGDANCAAKFLSSASAPGAPCRRSSVMRASVSSTLRGVADLVHDADAQRLRGRDALAGQAVAAEVAVAHGANEERRDAERRHPNPHLGDREERSLGRERHVAARRKRGAAADRRRHAPRRWWVSAACRGRRGRHAMSPAAWRSRRQPPGRRRRAKRGRRRCKKCRPLPRNTTTRT